MEDKWVLRNIRFEKPLEAAIEEQSRKEGITFTELVRVACREKVGADEAYKVMCEQNEDMA